MRSSMPLLLPVFWHTYVSMRMGMTKDMVMNICMSNIIAVKGAGESSTNLVVVVVVILVVVVVVVVTVVVVVVVVVVVAAVVPVQHQWSISALGLQCQYRTRIESLQYQYCSTAAPVQGDHGTRILPAQCHQRSVVPVS